MKNKKSFNVRESIQENTDNSIGVNNINSCKIKNVKHIEFFAQYKDPKWQKKRLEIMQRDEFRCQSCNDSDNTLNVHHNVPYRKDTNIWDYENNELTTLCETCHKSISEIIDYCKAIIMSRCWCVDSAGEVKKIMEEIDGMNPYQLNAIWKIIKECKKL